MLERPAMLAARCGAKLERSRTRSSRGRADGSSGQASTLGEVWAKVEANERLDLEDGLAPRVDDLLELGARRPGAPQRGGTDDVSSSRPLSDPDERLPREVQVPALRRPQSRARLHITTKELVADALKQRESPGSPRSTW